MCYSMSKRVKSVIVSFVNIKLRSSWMVPGLLKSFFICHIIYRGTIDWVLCQQVRYFQVGIVESYGSTGARAACSSSTTSCHIMHNGVARKLVPSDLHVVDASLSGFETFLRGCLVRGSAAWFWLYMPAWVSTDEQVGINLELERRC